MDGPVVDGDHGVVAHEPAETPCLGWCGERHEVVPGAVGTQEVRCGLERQVGVGELMLLAGQLGAQFAELSRQRRGQPLGGDPIEHGAEVVDGSIEVGEGLLEIVQRIHVDGAVHHP